MQYQYIDSNMDIKVLYFTETLVSVIWLYIWVEMYLYLGEATCHLLALSPTDSLARGRYHIWQFVRLPTCWIIIYFILCLLSISFCFDQRGGWDAAPTGPSTPHGRSPPPHLSAPPPWFHGVLLLTPVDWLWLDGVALCDVIVPSVIHPLCSL